MNLWYEFVYTTRLIGKKIGFVALCALVVALGYAISIPLYSLAKNFAYAPLPFPDGDRFVQVDQINTVDNSSIFSPSFDQFQYNAVAASVTGFERLGAYRDIGVAFNDGDMTRQFVATALTAEALNITATTPLLGRAIEVEDELPSAEPVVLLGYSVWQSYYGGQESVLGRSARINGVPHTIIGVMPPDFKYPLATDIWLPLSISATAEPGTEPLVLLVGVLNPNIDEAAASFELSELLQRLGNEHPEYYSDRSANVVPFTHLAFSGAYIAFNLAIGLAMSIFALVCLNIANLLTLRANERVSELAIRTALGATRRSLLMHVLFESLLICLCGAIVGLFTAKLILGAVESFIYNLFPDGRAVPFWFDFSYSADVGIVASLMLVLLWLSSGFFAAWRASNKDITEVLSSDSKGEPALADSKIVSVLVNIQVIVSFFLLVLCGVFLFQMQTFTSENAVENPERFFAAAIELNEDSYTSEGERENYREEFRQLLLENENIDAVTFSSSIPGTGVRGFEAGLEEEVVANQSDLTEAQVAWTSSNYFQVIGGTTLMQGRYFDEGDVDGAVNVVIIDDAFLRQLQLDESPIGKRILIQNEEESLESATIIGVVSNLSSESEYSTEPTPIVYRPLGQNSPSQFQLILGLTDATTITLAELDEQTRISGTRVDRDVSIFFMNSLAAITENNFALGRLVSSLFANAALASLILAIIGVYGAVSRSVSVRRREIGIRRAVGSSDRSITYLFLKKGFIYWSAAVILGGGLAVLIVNMLAAAILSQTLFATLGMVFTTVTLLFGLLIVFSSLTPVQKVISLEPGDAMRYE